MIAIETHGHNARRHSRSLSRVYNRAAVWRPRLSILLAPRGWQFLRSGAAVHGHIPKREMARGSGAVSQLPTVRRPDRPMTYAVRGNVCKNPAIKIINI